MTPPWPVPRCTPHGNRHACDVASSAVVRTGRVSPYSERCCDRNRCLAASQPISVAGREIEESASRFPSDRNRPDFSSPPAAACSSHPTPPTKKAPVQVPRNPTLSGSLASQTLARPTHAHGKKLCVRCPRQRSSSKLVDRVLAAAHERLQQRCDRDKIIALLEDEHGAYDDLALRVLTIWSTHDFRWGRCGPASRFLSRAGKSCQNPAGDFYLLISKARLRTVSELKRLYPQSVERIRIPCAARRERRGQSRERTQTTAHYNVQTARSPAKITRASGTAPHAAAALPRAPAPSTRWGATS